MASQPLGGSLVSGTSSRISCPASRAEKDVPLMQATPSGTIEFRIQVVSATDSRHALITSAQLIAVRALLNLATGAPR